MAGNKKISELPVATLPIATGVKFEALQGGINVQVDSDDMPGGSITREFNRAWSADLLFDKNEIFYTPHSLTGNITYTISSGTNLVNQSSSVIQKITVDGTQSISFGFGITPLGITNGGIPEAGTYYIAFLYWNGEAIANFMTPSIQEAGSVQLAAPSNFSAVADGQNAIDLSWTNVTNNQGYLIEFSLDGSTGWTTLETTAVNAVTSTQTGLSPGDTRYYRITTLGNGTSTLNSVYATSSAMTENPGDVTAPTFTFSPIGGAVDIGVSQNIILTADEGIQNTDGSALNNGNIAAVLTLKETNSGGANIPFTATIDGTKTIITITPTSGYGGNQLVYVAINNVEDVTGNEVTVAISSTFTTSGYTEFNGTSNYLWFGDILDGVWALANTEFKIKITVRNLPLVGDRFMLAKYSSTDNQRSFAFWTSGSDVRFTWCRVGTAASRVVSWAGALDAAEHELELQYDGSINTNDGLDRVTLLIDGVPAGSKTLAVSAGILSAIVNTSASLSFSAGVNGAGVVTSANYFAGEAKDLQVLSGAGDVNELEVPVLREGTDISGNGRNGTWV